MAGRRSHRNPQYVNRPAHILQQCEPQPDDPGSIKHRPGQLYDHYPSHLWNSFSHSQRPRLGYSYWIRNDPSRNIQPSELDLDKHHYNPRPTRHFRHDEDQNISKREFGPPETMSDRESHISEITIRPPAVLGSKIERRSLRATESSSLS